MILIVRLLIVLVAIGCASAAEWTRFRGPNGAGVAEGSALPREIGPDKNVVWKTAIPMGKSSPAVTANRIFLTGHKDKVLETFALDRKTGKLLWSRESPGQRDEKRNKLNDPAAPSPVSDGANVYVFFAGFGLVSYTGDGEERWRLPLGPFANFHGMAASPVLAEGKVLMICDQDQQAFLIAVDQNTGKPVWRVERSDMVHSFTTPVVYRNEKAGRTELIVPGSFLMTSYDVANGKVIWTLRGITYQVKSGPVIDGEVLYFNGWAPGSEPSERIELPDFQKMLELHDKNGDKKIARAEIPKEWQPANWEMQDLNKDDVYDERDWKYYMGRRTSTNGAIAVKMGGTGDITDTHLLWRYQKSLPDVSSVLLYRGVLYLIRNGGILQTLEPATGKLIKQGRLTHAMDEYYASPVAGDGKVFLLSRDGKSTALEAGSQDWGVAATGDFGEEVFATPAIADGHMWVRTATALFDLSAATPAVK